ncbi:hypothetical protein K5D42_25225 [Pseudomonas cichorii]|nr:LPD7 domain-containing protein [Pseudomonas cichorii]MBX8493176.1 hypothetical protein [Pseudomonas cichorii]
MKTYQYPVWLAVEPDDKDKMRTAAGKLSDGKSAVAYDAKEKLWYARPGCDIDSIKEWLPDRSVRAGGGDPAIAFKDFLTQGGLIIDGLPIMDGKKRSVKTVEGKKSGKKSGVYRGFSNGKPSGWYVNYHREDEYVKWVSEGGDEDPVARRHIRAAAKQDQDDSIRKKEIAYAKKSSEAKKLYDQLPVVDPKQGYLVRKGISPTDDIRQTRSGSMVVPIYDVKGNFKTLQYIPENGDKLLFAGAPKFGNFHVVGGALLPGQPILYAEGYATARSINMATGIPVVMTIDAGNMVEVSKILNREYPNAQHIFLADFDHAKKVNKGLITAAKAAVTVGGQVLYPYFNAQEIAKGLTDFNDLHSSRGQDAVLAQISPLLDSLTNPLKRSAFEDLISNSSGVKVAVPIEWAGGIEKKGLVVQDKTDLVDAGDSKPDIFRIYVENSNAEYVWVADYDKSAQADQLISELQSIHNDAAHPDNVMFDLSPQPEENLTMQKQTLDDPITQTLPEQSSDIEKGPDLAPVDPDYWASHVLRVHRASPFNEGLSKDANEEVKFLEQREFNRFLNDAFGIPMEIPIQWSGVVEVEGNVIQDGVFEPAGDRTPEIFSVYVEKMDGEKVWVIDFFKQEEVNSFVAKLKQIDEGAKHQQSVISNVSATVAQIVDNENVAQVQPLDDAHIISTQNLLADRISNLESQEADVLKNLKNYYDNYDSEGAMIYEAESGLDKLRATLKGLRDQQVSDSGEPVPTLEALSDIEADSSLNPIANVEEPNIEPAVVAVVKTDDYDAPDLDKSELSDDPVPETSAVQQVMAEHKNESADPVYIPIALTPVQASEGDLTPYERNQLRSLGWTDKQLSDVQVDQARVALLERTAYEPPASSIPDKQQPAPGQTPVASAEPIEQAEVATVPVSAPVDAKKATEIPADMSVDDLMSLVPRRPAVEDEAAAEVAVDAILVGPRVGKDEPAMQASLIDMDALMVRVTGKPQKDNSMLYSLDDDPAFIDRGSRIEMVPGAGQSDEKILAALINAAQWYRGHIELTGSDAFKTKAIELIAKQGINVTMKNPAQRFMLDQARNALTAAKVLPDAIVGENPQPFNPSPLSATQPLPSSVAAQPAANQSAVATTTTTLVANVPEQATYTPLEAANVATAVPAPVEQRAVSATPQIVEPVSQMDPAVHQPAMAAANGVVGKVISCGEEPFQFNPENQPSVHIKLRTKAGIQTFWGKELAGLLRETRIEPGRVVSLQWMGKEQVVVKVPIQLEGRVVGYKPKEALRNKWSMSLVNGPSIKTGDDQGVMLTAYDAARFGMIQSMAIGSLNLPQIQAPVLPNDGLFWMTPNGHGSAKAGDALSASRPAVDSNEAGKAVMTSWTDDGHLDMALFRGDGPYLQGVVRHGEVYKHVLVSLPGTAGAAPMVFNEITENGLVPIGVGNGINRSGGEAVAREHIAFKLEGDGAVRIGKLDYPADVPPALHARLGFDERWKDTNNLPKSAPAAAHTAQPSAVRPS